MDGSVQTPPAARVATTIIAVFTIAALSFCLTRRTQAVQSWRTLPIPGYLLIVLYVDALLFVASTMIMSKSFNVNLDMNICDGAIVLCLLFYTSTKVIMYFFLAEKVHVIRNPLGKARRKSKLYLFNVLGAIIPYSSLVTLAFVFRLYRIDDHGVCVIGIHRWVLIPLTTGEVAMNVWLTGLFLQPFRDLHSLKNKGGNSTQQALRKVVTRTFIGSCATLASTVANLAATAALNGEQSWVCLMICNLEILWAILVLHWMTSVDSQKIQSNEKPASNSAHPTGSTSLTEPDYDNIILNEVYLKTPAVEKDNPFAGDGILLVREYSVEDIEQGKSETGSVEENPFEKPS